MKFVFITLFPELIAGAASVSILGRAQKEGLIEVLCVNPRDYATDRHRSVDDTTCGGGAGMVLRVDTYLAALEKARCLAPDALVAEEADLRLSVGDFVMTGGELPALSVMDAVARFVPGVLGKLVSAEEDSFSGSLLEHPQYTRPISYEGKKVPDILLSGDHEKIGAWRRKKEFEATLQHRPDLFSTMTWQKGDGRLFLEMLGERHKK